jgi:hypothetical protein
LNTELVPELLSPLPLRNSLNGLHFLVRPITDSAIAKRANETLQGVVHLELLRNVGGAIDSDPKPIRLAELQVVGIDLKDLTQLVLLERTQIGTKYLPSAQHTYMSSPNFVENEETGQLEVQFVLSEIPNHNRS